MEHAAKLILATTLILAGGLKLQDPNSFLASLTSFNLLPELLLQPTASWIPILEICTGVLLFYKPLEGGALAVCTFLFLGFSVFYGWSLILGIQPNCSCFGNNPYLQTNNTNGLIRALFYTLLSAGTWHTRLSNSDYN